MLLYEAVGKGTEILSQRKPGEFLNVIGPLGNGFKCYPLSAIRYPLILVAGGMGTAPLVFLAEKLREVKIKGERKNIGFNRRENQGKISFVKKNLKN